MPLLFELARGKDAKLAMEACKSLGKLASASDHEQLVALLLGAGDDDLREAAAAALVAAAKRIGDPAKSLAPLLAAWDKASTELKVTLLAIYAAVGGEQALAQLATCTTATQPEVKRAAIEALADDSDDARALPALLAVVRAEPDKSLNVRAMRGYLRILRQDEGLRPPVKVQHLVAGLAATKRLDDQKQCLQLLRECRVNEAVDAVAAALDQADLRIEAANAILYLASDQKKGNKQLRAVKGAATKKALQKIIDVVEDATLKAQAQKLL